MSKGARESRKQVEAICAEAGVTIEAIDYTGSGHWKVKARTPGGHPMLLFTGSTPSDVRSLANFRGVVRRQVRQLDGT